MKFTVRGQVVRSESRRRYIVVAVRANPIVTDQGTFVAFARVEKRSDSRETARTLARRFNNGFQGHGVFAVVVDTVEGVEVA